MLSIASHLKEEPRPAILILWHHNSKHSGKYDFVLHKRMPLKECRNTFLLDGSHSSILSSSNDLYSYRYMVQTSRKTSKWFICFTEQACSCPRVNPKSWINVIWYEAIWLVPITVDLLQCKLLPLSGPIITSVDIEIPLNVSPNLFRRSARMTRNLTFILGAIHRGLGCLRFFFDPGMFQVCSLQEFLLWNFLPPCW